MSGWGRADESEWEGGGDEGERRAARGGRMVVVELAVAPARRSTGSGRLQALGTCVVGAVAGHCRPAGCWVVGKATAHVCVCVAFPCGWPSTLPPPSPISKAADPTNQLTNRAINEPTKPHLEAVSIEEAAGALCHRVSCNGWGGGGRGEDGKGRTARGAVSGLGHWHGHGLARSGRQAGPLSGQALGRCTADALSWRQGRLHQDA